MGVSGQKSASSAANASSSRAAMVALQMAARGALPPDALWEQIEGAIDRTTGSSMASALESGSDVRSAYLGSLTCS